MGLYPPPDGITNLKYKLLYFLTPNKKKSKRKVLAFNRDRCWHLAICLQLVLFRLDNRLLNHIQKGGGDSKEAYLVYYYIRLIVYDIRLVLQTGGNHNLV